VSRSHRTRVPLALWVLPALACLSLVPAARSGEAPESRTSSPGGWPLSGRTFDGQRYSPLTQIGRKSVARLGLAWEFRDFIVRGRTHRALEANPVLVDGVLYFSGPWGVAYALDARTGRHLWTYDPQADGQYARSACCDAVNRGVAVWQGRVYVASLDGYLIALDSRSGQPLWRVDTFVDRKWNYVITGAPHLAGRNILIGNAGGDMGARGYVSAYDARTGQLVWRFWAVPGDPRKGPDESPEVTLARKTWAAGARWDLGGGGGAWDAMAYDPALGLLYVGLGNGDPHPRWLRSPGGGDNLFLASIVALDASTGRMRWYYQETPGDSWDYDATAPFVLADLRWHGRTRRVLMQASKNGIFYVLDRKTGELLGADPFATVNWTDGIDLKTGRPHVTARADYSRTPQIIWPSGAGAHGWEPMSYDPLTGWVYVPVSDAPMKFESAAQARFMPGFMNQAERGTFPPYTSAADRRALIGEPQPRIEGRLKAWDPRHGRAAWISRPLPFLAGGTLSTAGGLVLEGTADGQFSVYDARSGALLKRIATGTAILAAPMTYELDDVQYVAVLAGAGGPQAGRYGPDVAAAHFQNFERLLVFKLDGGPTPLPPPVLTPTMQPSPAPVRAQAATLERGQELFEAQCARCHVLGGAFGAYPNLWNLAPATWNAFDVIVLGGAFREAGMANFSDVLSRSDAAAIKAFIIDDELKRRVLGEPAAARPVPVH